MGLFDFLFRRNPTADWRETVAATAVDITGCQVMGKGFRSRTADFAALGPASKWPAKNGCGMLVYPPKGLQLDFEYDQFVGVTITLLRLPYEQDPAAKPFQGRLTRAGTPLQFGAGASEAEIVEAFCSPHARDEDDEETILKYEFGNVVLEFELFKAQGLGVINVFCEGDVKPL